MIGANALYQKRELQLPSALLQTGWLDPGLRRIWDLQLPSLLVGAVVGPFEEGMVAREMITACLADYSRCARKRPTICWTRGLGFSRRTASNSASASA